jgi:uncharacterized DUF497 family protein
MSRSHRALGRAALANEALGGETIRVISAREAELHERRRYREDNE